MHSNFEYRLEISYIPKNYNWFKSPWFKSTLKIDLLGFIWIMLNVISKKVYGLILAKKISPFSLSFDAQKMSSCSSKSYADFCL